MATDTMAKFIAANSKDASKKDVAALKRLGFQELTALFRKTSEVTIEEKKQIFELLREQLPVYAAQRK
jgi:hypothetical protein